MLPDFFCTLIFSLDRFLMPQLPIGISTCRVNRW